MQLISTLFLLSSAASTAFGVTHNVQVAVNKALAYSPNSIVAAVGDTVEFDFQNGNHSVVQAAFATPCVPISNGFFSGFVPVGPGKPNTFTIDVTTTDPIWFYCAQAMHCQSGMVGVINVNPNSNKTLDAFTAAAKMAPANVAPPTGPVGGVLSTTTIASNTTTNTTVTSTGTGAPLPVVTANGAVVPTSISQAGSLLSLAMMVMGLLM